MHVHIPTGTVQESKYGPIYADQGNRAQKVVDAVLLGMMFCIMLGMGIWEATMYGMNPDTPDSQDCKVIQIRNIMLANGVLDISAALVAAFMILSMTTLFPPTVSLHTNNTMGCCHTVLSIGSISLMIANSVLTWGSNCKLMPGHFYHMMNVMLIVMWSVMGAYFLFSVFASVVAKAIDKKNMEDKEDRYQVVNNDE
ncbi:hypothetical protein AKO1_015213 [Acrasis kona]|uniref:PGG domain-containing protein n=1 Tax=Acrasis kona TaxID=1008807 RepID=A0AAW2ZFB6_9EUKA